MGHIHLKFNRIYGVVHLQTHINSALVGAVFHNKRYADGREPGKDDAGIKPFITGNLVVGIIR